MPFHASVSWTNVAINMGMSFAFWFVLGMLLGGDRYAPAIIGMSISGIRSVIAGPTAMGQLPDNLGVISAKTWTSMPGWARGGGTGVNVWSAFISAGITFVFWLVAGYFLIRGSAWKYALTAAGVAGVGGLLME